MADNEMNDRYSPRLLKNWDKFKSWAIDQDFIPEEIVDASSYQEAVKIIDKLKAENENDEEYFENLSDLLQAVEQLYINMCLIDEKMRKVIRKS